jgi:hypothetical protein
MLIKIVTLALVLWGISATTQDGMIFSKAADWVTNKYKGVWHKPLFSCPMCMASVWGLIASVYWDLSIAEWLVLTFGVCGLNFVIYQHLSK